MPHIDPRRRVQIAKPNPQGAAAHPSTAGELTWLLTEVVRQYIDRVPTSFAVFAEVIAALEQTKDEFRRLVVHPYEDEAIKRNGSAYDPEHLLPAALEEGFS